MTLPELRAACPSNDTGGYIEWLEERVLALTADEEPRQAAKRIADAEWFPLGYSRMQLIDAITTAIQVASNAQLESGRKALVNAMEDQSRLAKEARERFEAEIAKVDKARKREAENYNRVVAELEHEQNVIFCDAAKHDHVGHVRAFMEKFDQHIGDTPGWPPQEVLDLRIRLIAEEFCEMLVAGGYEGNMWIARPEMPPDFGGVSFVQLVDWQREADEPSEVARKLPAFIDALLDLEYVILGTHVACGVDPQPIWERVNASNMAKQPAADKFSKITKPSGWQAPDIAGALKEQGWQGGAE